MTPRRGARIFPHLVALLCYTGAAVILTWPMVTAFTTAIASARTIHGYLYDAREDGIQNVWNIWWTLRALRSGHNPFWTDLLYYPDGVQLYVQTVGLSNFLAMLPVAALFGPVAGFNAAVLLAIAGSGYAAFLLARFFTRHLGIALLCGLLLTASPFHMFKLQIHQLNLISFQWLILYLLALLHLERNPSWRTVLATIGATVLVVLSDWYWLLIALIGALPWGLAALARSPRRADLLRAFAGVGAGVGLATLPLLIGIVQARHRLPAAAPRDAIWFAYIQGFSADLLGLLAPNMLHPLWGERLWEITRPPPTDFAADGWYVAAGWVLLGCAALGLPELWRRQRPLALMGLVAWLLSLGPVLRIAGQPTGLPLPYALVQELPLVQIARRPSLFTTLVLLVAVVAAALGLQRLLAAQPPGRGRLLLGAIAVLALIELAPPGPAQRQLIVLEPPPLMAELRARPGAVADLPFAPMEDSRSLLNQIGHEQPIIGGYVACWPSYPALERAPLLGAIAHMGLTPDIAPIDLETLVAMQCAYPVRHILLYRPEVGPDQYAAVAELAAILAGAPPAPRVVGDYLWYELPVPSPPCPPFVSLGAGWHPLEEHPSGRSRWMDEEAVINLINPQPRSLPVLLDLELIAFGQPRPLVVTFGNGPPAAWIVQSDQPRRYTTYVLLDPGVSELCLRAPAASDPAAPRRISLRASEVAVRPVEP